MRIVGLGQVLRVQARKRWECGSLQVELRAPRALGAANARRLLTRVTAAAADGPRRRGLAIGRQQWPANAPAAVVAVAAATRVAARPAVAACDTAAHRAAAAALRRCVNDLLLFGLAVRAMTWELLHGRRVRRLRVVLL